MSLCEIILGFIQDVFQVEALVILMGEILEDFFSIFGLIFW